MADEKVTSTPFRILSPVSGDTLGTSFTVDGTVDWNAGGTITVTLTVPGHAPIAEPGQPNGHVTWQANFTNAPTGTGASIEATWTMGSPPWPTVNNLTIQ